MKSFYVVAITFLFFANFAKAHPIKIIIDSAESKIFSQYNLHDIESDSITYLKKVKEIIADLHSRGFLTGYYGFKDSSSIYLVAGNKFKWAKLTAGNVPDIFIRMSGFREKSYRNSAFRFEEAALLMKRIVHMASDNGFPFANLKLDSLIIESSTISASLNFVPGPYVVFDSITIYGTNQVKLPFLYSALDINPGTPYSEQKINRIENVLRQLPYLELTDPPYVQFVDKKARVFLNVKYRKINQIDGLVGFLPNSGADKKLLVTGMFNLHLYNLFSRGHSLQLEWKKTDQYSQDLNFSYVYPYILTSPLWSEVNFSLLKQDTSFINKYVNLKLTYKIPKVSFSVFSGINTSRILSNSKKEAEEFPEIISNNLIQYGISVQSAPDFTNGNRNINLYDFEITMGNKRIINDSGFPVLFSQNLKKKTTQYSFKFNISRNQTVTKQFGIFGKVQGGFIESDNLFLNDLFRLGGINSLRGFSDNYFYASSYIVGTSEFRFFFENTSYFFAFFDKSYINRNINQTAFSSYPEGLGIGLFLQIRNSNLKFVYGMGKTKNQSYSLNLSKIHIGYTTLF